MDWRRWDFLRRETAGIQICAHHFSKIANWPVRLLDFTTQEVYYGMIEDRYAECCARLSQDDSLSDSFATLSLGNGEVNIKSEKPSKTETQSVRELSTIMMAMRKLREAIVATSRTDAFAQKAYLFIVRATILTKHMESYHPAILHLLSKIHPTSPLSKNEYHEFVGYHILDLACRQNDVAQAYHVRNRMKYRDTRVEMILHAIVHGNWYQFWNAHESADEYQKRLMEWYVDEVRRHVLDCFRRSYLVVDKSYVEKAAASSWEHLQKTNSLDWEVKGDAVTIRRIKAK